MRHPVKKPTESRADLILMIWREKRRIGFSEEEFVEQLMKNFTNVDLKLILEDLRLIRGT